MNHFSQNFSMTSFKSLSIIVVFFFMVNQFAYGQEVSPSMEFSPFLASQSSMDKAIGFSALKSKAGLEDTIRVIISLEQPFLPRGDLPKSEFLVLQKQSIGNVQKQFLTEIESFAVEDEIVHQFQFVPQIIMEVNRETLEALEASEQIRFIEEDVVYPPLLANSAPAIGADKAWDLGFDGSGQTIVILDTGFDSSHPMLDGKIVSEACFSTTSSSFQQSSVSACPGNANQAYGSGSAAPCSVFLCDHGTHVAGIAAGNTVPSGPTISYSGIAKGANIIGIQVFSEFTRHPACGAPCALTYDGDIRRALEYVYSISGQYDIASVNLSLGGGEYSSECNSEAKQFVDQLKDFGIATIAASGNFYDNFPNGITSPACISNVVSVGAVNNDDDVWEFSQKAPILDFLAPGYEIRSSLPGNQLWYKSGTSMSAPHVSGAWAVLKQSSPNSSVQEIFDVLKSTAIDVEDTRGGTIMTFDRIQLDDALCALNPSVCEEVTEPDEEVTAPDEEVTAPDEEVTAPDEEVTEPDEEVTEPDENGGGCLIATAAYGTELAPQVQFLREIRDNTVMSTASGTAFMTGFNQLYYSFSPTIADMERENPMFQEVVRAFITPMVSTLSIITLAEDGSEVEVLGLGISVIALNLGMYIAAPALIGFKVHNHFKSRK